MSLILTGMCQTEHVERNLSCGYFVLVWFFFTTVSYIFRRTAGALLDAFQCVPDVICDLQNKRTYLQIIHLFKVENE